MAAYESSSHGTFDVDRDGSVAFAAPGESAICVGAHARHLRTALYDQSNGGYRLTAKAANHATLQGTLPRQTTNSIERPRKRDVHRP